MQIWALILLIILQNKQYCFLLDHKGAVHEKLLSGIWLRQKLFLNHGQVFCLLERHWSVSAAIRFNGDPSDFRYENIEIINRFYGVTKEEKNGRQVYYTRIHVNGYFLVGVYPTEQEAAIAYNKAIDYGWWFRYFHNGNRRGRRL